MHVSHFKVAVFLYFQIGNVTGKSFRDEWDHDWLGLFEHAGC